MFSGVREVREMAKAERKRKAEVNNIIKATLFEEMVAIWFSCPREIQRAMYG
jgi:hypothetical protein